MDTNNNRQHNCSISLSTITTADSIDDKIEDNMSLEELRACLNIEAATMKKKLQQIQKSDTDDKEARRIRRIQKREESKRLKNIEYVNQWDVFFQDFNLLDSTANQQLQTKSYVAKKDDIDDNSIPTQRLKRRRTISLRALSKSLSIRQGRNRKMVRYLNHHQSR